MAGRPKKLIQDEAGEPAEPVTELEEIVVIAEPVTEREEVKTVESVIENNAVINPCAACGVEKGSRLCKTCVENKG